MSATRTSSRTRVTTHQHAHGGAAAAAAASHYSPTAIVAVPPASSAAPATAPGRSSKTQVHFREVVDSQDPNSRYQLLVRWRSPTFTLTVISPPHHDGRDGDGWIKTFNGPLNDSMQPASLPAQYRYGFSERVWQGLSGRALESDIDRYTFSVREVESDRALEVSRRRSELRVAYKTHTLIRLVLTPPHHADGSKGGHSSTSSPSKTHTQHQDEYKHFRDGSLQFIKQLQDLTNDGQGKLVQRAAQVTKNAADMEERLAVLQDRATRKLYMEEGLLGWFHRILSAKDKELARLESERVKLEHDLAGEQMRQQQLERDASPGTANSFGLLIPGSGSQPLTEDDIRALGHVVDDEGASDASGDSDHEREGMDEDGGESSAAESKASKRKKATTSRKPSTAASADASSTTGRKKAATPGAKAAPKPRKPRAPAKSRAKKATAAASSDSSDDESSKPSPKRTRKRIRSPIPEEDEDDGVDGGESISHAAGRSDDDDGAAAAIAQVAAYEAREKELLAEPTIPLPSRRPTRATTATSTPASAVTASHYRTRPPTPLPSPFPSSASLASSPPASLDPSSPPPPPASKKRRTVSPPPRVLPKKSLAEILRAGAAGALGSEEMDEEEAAAGFSPTPVAVQQPVTLASGRRQSSRGGVVSHVAADGTAPMEMSSQ